MPSEVILDLLSPLLIGGLGALFWARLNRLEDEVANIRATMATKDDLNLVRQEMGAMRDEMAKMATKDDVNTLREDMRAMRSDLTHVALAVGANRPKPAEGETSAN